MYGSNVERILNLIDRIQDAITDFSDTGRAVQLKSISRQYDSAMSKVNLIEKNIYVRSKRMHNHIGSPYTEMDRLKKAMHDVLRLEDTEENKEKIQFALCRIHQLAIDAKFCILKYGDYMERGYNYIQGQDPVTTK